MQRLWRCAALGCSACFHIHPKTTHLWSSHVQLALLFWACDVKKCPSRNGGQSRTFTFWLRNEREKETRIPQALWDILSIT